MYEELGDAARHRALNEEVLAAARAGGNKRVITTTLCALARHARNEADYRGALELLREAYANAKEIGERAELPDALSLMAMVLAAAGHPAAATRLAARARALSDEIRGHKHVWVVEREEETVATVKAGLGEEEFARLWEEGRALSEDEVVALALEDRGFAE